MSYASSNFLVYAIWEQKREGHATLCGSLLLGCAETEEEALEKVQVYKQRADTYDTGFSSTTEKQYIYIPNKVEWWIKDMIVASESPQSAPHSP